MLFDLHTRAPGFLTTCLSVGLALILMTGMGVTSLYAQQKIQQVGKRVPYEAVHPDWKDCGLRKRDVNAFVSHRPSAKALQQAKTATIEVEYGAGFSPEARQAFQRAVEIWETHVSSDVTINIDASFEELGEELGSNVLGGAGSRFVYPADIDSDPEADVFFGDALFDALRGSEQQGGEPDIVARFNSNRDDWHFGEEDAPAGEIDFTTVVLHEIGHGLNYFGQTNVENGEGTYGTIDFDQDGRPDGIPSIFTVFLAEKAIDGSFTSLTDEGAFPNPSQELGDAMTGTRLFYDGEKSNEAATESDGPTPAKMYAPTVYEQGSSISHLDEETYGFEGENSLMTPQVATAETNRLPGPIVCGQLADMGWTLGAQCEQYFQEITNLRFDETAGSNPASVTLTWEEKPDARIQEYQVERRYFDGAFETAKAGVTAPPVTIDSLGLGRFAFRVRWVNDDGTEGVSVRVLERIVNLEGVSPSVTAGASGRGTVELSWTIPPGTPEGTTFRVERAPGQEGGRFREVVGSTERQSDRQYRFTAERQTPGRYRYRVVSQDGQGNELEGAPTPIDISFEGVVFIAGPSPNPAQNQAVVELTAQETQDASVEVYNSIGERVYVEERSLEGQRPVRLVLDSRRWGSGVYFLRVTGRDFTKTRKMVVVH